jgi:2-dehydropantoate 2-reductase
MKILVFGAGVIGSLYAVKFSLAGFEVELFARGKRFEVLKNNGLQYHDKGALKKASIKIIDKLENDDIYDYIFVTVRYDQAETALMDIRQNQSKNIVTMINTVGYNRWVEIIGDRLIPGFPAAGGDIKENILYAQIASKNIGGTIFGEINGEITERIKSLSNIFETANIPFEISRNILAYHITHAAAVTGTRHFYTENGVVDIKTARNFRTLKNIAFDTKNNLSIVEKMEIPITPKKLKIIKNLPILLFVVALYFMLNSKFIRDSLLGNHAYNARHEVFLLDKNFHNLYCAYKSIK